MCKISVVMGVYQSKKKLLDKSVESVLAQTFEDFELIIVCDGAKETLPLLKEWEKKDRRIKVLCYEKNRGLAFALNYAIAHAKGEFVARQDDDDTSFLNRFEKQFAYLSENPSVSFVCSDAEIYDDEGTYAATQMPKKPTKEDFLFTCPFLHPTMMIRREVLEKVGGYRVTWSTKKTEDYDLYMRLFIKGYFGVNMKEKLYSYRFERIGKRKRSLLDRLGEVWVRIKNFSRMKMGIKGAIYAFKPLVAWLLPRRVLDKKRKYIQ